MRGYQKLSRSFASSLVAGAILLAAWFAFALQATTPVAAEASSKAAPAEAAMRGELVYVPIYSSIYYDNGTRTLELAATLSIHNVNPDRPITVVRADYYNSDGKLIKRYLDAPLQLAALQTRNVVIHKENNSGGIGANFLVEWHAAPAAANPLIESVMVNAASNLGIAFTATGKVVRQVTVATR